MTDDIHAYEHWLKKRHKTTHTESYYLKLSQRQKSILKQLKQAGDTLEFAKSHIRVQDIVRFAATENVEFSLFTKGNRRIVVRGYYNETPIGHILKKLIDEKWKLSAHTHPGMLENTLKASPNDARFLLALGQKQSVVLNQAGRYKRFNVSGVDL